MTRCLQVRSVPIALAALALAALALAVAPSGAKPQPEQQGIIGLVVGDITIAREGGPLRASEGLAVLFGDTLIARAQSTCQGLGPDGAPFALAGPAQLVFSPPRQAGADQGLKSWIARQLAQWIGVRRQQSLTTRGERTWKRTVEVCQPIWPCAGGRLRGGPAHLYWSTLQGIDRYTVEIVSPRGQVMRKTVAGNSLRVSDLEPGVDYEWSVAPDTPGWPAAARRSGFQLLPPAEEVELDSALQALPPLEAAILLLSMGMNDEAIDRLETALADPALCEAALRWRAEAYAGMGLLAEANADLRRASLMP